uniref:Tigger transposable element-derived protein 1-like n=1 Tax=Pelodiscus sinensis TaxID=13735 RepID=K7GAG5_PELSI
MSKGSASDVKSKVGECTRHRSSVSQNAKLDVLDHNRKGECSDDIAHRLGMPLLTLCMIIKNHEKILETAKLVLKHASVKQRSERMEKMERLLSIWLHNLYKHNLYISLPLVQQKTMSLYKEGETCEPGHFNAISGWFYRFQKRYGFKNVQVLGEAVRADKDVTEAFPKMLKTIIKEGGYNLRQVFNSDEMGLYWKCMLSRTCISVNQKSAPGFKALKDLLTLLLGGNVDGDKKLKPLLVYCSENPCAMKSRLLVIWKSHRKVWMTRNLFCEWFLGYFVPEMKKYYEENNLTFKILLILDNASAHNLDFESLCPNIVFFMPPRITSLMQPMVKGLSQTSKLIIGLIQEIAGEGKPTVQEFWKKINIMDAVMIISAAWQYVSNCLMKR